MVQGKLQWSIHVYTLKCKVIFFFNANHIEQMHVQRLDKDVHKIGMANIG